MRILLIETDRFLARNLQRALKRAGHDTDWLIDLQTAINAADASKPDVVILDLLLAGRSGIEFLYEFRSYPEWNEIPVIVYSNIPDSELRQGQEAFAQLGISHFLYKPAAKLDELVNLVERLAFHPLPAVIPK